ncbi:MAG: hypothetical protein AAF664_18140 [Planctomycetota bacterium]
MNEEKYNLVSYQSWVEGRRHRPSTDLPDAVMPRIDNSQARNDVIWDMIWETIWWNRMLE